ncbi:MAG: glycolate oxidase iron-sulfur subunit [Candidatus Azotimanducaceae bacterium]|jgi:glycolate oxidase iron-sulfur subunit
MQTEIHPNLKLLPEVTEAEAILRSCVHCGFCTAVCPTYLELGDDLDSPRGRIYLIKTILEEDAVSPEMNQHLDRCLTCRSCETTCPSGVQYGRLLDIGKDLIETRYKPARPLLRQLKSAVLRILLPRPKLFAVFYKLGLMFRPLLPLALKNKMPLSPVPELPPSPVAKPQVHLPTKTALVLQGCVQRSLTPGVNRATEKLLAMHDIDVRYLSEEGCCGAVDYHLGHHETGVQRVRRLIDKLHPELDQVEWIISTASGCGVMLKDYPSMLKDDSEYLQKAEQILAKTWDISEVLGSLKFSCQPMNVAVHTPCTLQHGQKLPNVMTEILRAAGANLVPVAEPHLCCGSAGTYSVLEEALAGRLTTRKVACLTEHAPDVIVTANVGCQAQLSAYADTPVMHWVEFLAHYPSD